MFRYVPGIVEYVKIIAFLLFLWYTIKRDGGVRAMTINQEILNITEAIKQAIPAERIYLFGSYVYGTPDADSDYDFFVVIPDGSLCPLDAMKMARRSLRTLDRKTPVDILADYKSRFDDRRNFNTLERKIANEGMVLYER